jgi:hypothetical protein
VPPSEATGRAGPRAMMAPAMAAVMMAAVVVAMMMMMIVAVVVVPAGLRGRGGQRQRAHEGHEDKGPQAESAQP